MGGCLTIATGVVAETEESTPWEVHPFSPVMAAAHEAPAIVTTSERDQKTPPPKENQGENLGFGIFFTVEVICATPVLVWQGLWTSHLHQFQTQWLP